MEGKVWWQEGEVASHIAPEAGRRDRLHHSLLFIQSRTSAYGTALFTFWMGLPSLGHMERLDP